MEQLRPALTRDDAARRSPVGAEAVAPYSSATARCSFRARPVALGGAAAASSRTQAAPVRSVCVPNLIAG